MRRTAWFNVALALLGPLGIALVYQRLLRVDREWTVSVIATTGFLLLVASVAAIARRREKLSWSVLGFHGVGRKTLPLAVALSLFTIFIYGPVAVWGISALGLGSFEMIPGPTELPTWYFVGVIVIVASGEEWLYRGYALERLLALTGSPWIAGTITVLAFAAAHLPLWPSGPVLSFVVSGAIGTLVYLWSRDIVALAIAHVTADLYGLVVA